MPFNGITNLRDAKETVKLSPKQLNEIKKCALDPLYFMNNYMYINTKDNGMQLFKTWPFQDEAVKRFLKYRFNINKWSRQVGKSTIVRGFILWYAMFHSDQLVAMLANKLALAKEQLQLLRDSYVALPFWLQPGVKLWNKMSIQFSNNTRILVAATTPDGVRGFSPNLLYLDEFAFLRNGLADDFMASVFPSISSGKKTRVIITSCVTKDTMVFTPDGIKTVEDFIIDDGRVLGYEVPEYQVLGRYGMNRGHIMHNDGAAKETRVISTRYSEVETSLMHKFWTCRDGVYQIRRAQELKVGDYVMIKYGMNCWGDDKIDFDDSNTKHHRSFKFGHLTEITEAIAYLFGLYIAEGNINTHAGNQNLMITCGDNIDSVFTNLGLTFYKRDDFHYQISSASLVELFQYVGFDPHRHANSKIIPTRLMRMSKRNVAAMIRGMFDGDGCSNKNRKRLSYTSASKRLIDQLRVLLANFGILSTMTHAYIKPTARVKVSSETWSIEINQQSMVDLYFDEIGFGLTRKSDTRFVQPGKKQRPSRYDYIPFAAQEIRRLKKERVLTNKEFKLTGGICDKHDIHLNRKLVLEIKSKLPESVWSKYDVFKNAEPDCVWTPITEITKSFNKVYDFSLDDDNYDGSEWAHSVIYNGMSGFQTPQGLNHFYRMWEDAVDENTASYHDLTSRYVRSVVKWNEVPGRDAQWGIDEMARIGEQKFRQEYECEFIGSAVTLIDYKILQKLKPDDPLKMANTPPDFQMRMFQKPIIRQKMELNGWTYIASIDTGYGIRKDYHVLQILLAKSNIDLEQVFVMSSNTVTIEDFCAYSYLVLKGYGFPPLTIEYNGPGARTLGIMFNNLQYENLVHYDNKLRGMWATDTIKQAAVMLLKLYVQRFYCKLHDEATINELMSFTTTTESGRKWGATGGNHDDHVTSLYWCIYYAASPMFEGGNVEEVDFLKGLELAFTAIGNTGEETNRALEFVQDQIAQREQLAIGRLQQQQQDLETTNGIN
ncbi:LAGLIDADG family homing endonuclease [Fibrobacter sp.]|uniref:LAGLIDADG family homing endonuclease n=1 Tax=Fibrobacter sp. TaxID=35828 RepID=UPI00386AB84D